MEVNRGSLNQPVSNFMSENKNRFNSKRNIILIVLLSLPVFYLGGFEGGYLRDEISMGSELKSPSDALAEWKLSDEAPFKYRVLFKAVVHQVASLVFSGSNRDFYYAYIIVSYSFFLATIVALYSFIRLNGFSPGLTWLGLGFFLVSPVVLMAYKIPVHVREDYMAYFILLLGLIAIHKNNFVLLLITFIVGPLCRETLLILPFTYLFFTRNHTLVKRLFLAGMPIIIIIIIRFLIGYEKYDYFLGLRWNIDNPIQVIGFSLITFHFMWIPLIVYLFIRKRMNLLSSYLDKSLLPVIGLVVTTTLIGGIFNEIRLLFLVFPWVIIAVLRVIEKNEQIGLSEWFSKSKMSIYLIFQPFIIFIVFYLSNKINIVGKSAYEIPYYQWILVSLLYFEMMLFALIHYFSVFRMIYKPKKAI